MTSIIWNIINSHAMNLVGLILFILLQVGDIITTKKALSNPNAKEANPIIAKLMEIFGILPALIISKLLVIIAITVWFYPHWSIWVVNILYIFVVIHNSKFAK